MTGPEATVFCTPPAATDAGSTVHLLTMVGHTVADIAAASRPLVFEQLLRLSYGDVRRYRSDYFHDARWLAEHLNTVPFWFVYVWSESGMWLAAGDDAASVVSAESGARRALITLRVADHHVLLDVERLNAGCREPRAAPVEST